MLNLDCEYYQNRFFNKKSISHVCIIQKKCIIISSTYTQASCRYKNHMNWLSIGFAIFNQVKYKF